MCSAAVLTPHMQKACAVQATQQCAPLAYLALSANRGLCNNLNLEPQSLRYVCSCHGINDSNMAANNKVCKPQRTHCQRATTACAHTMVQCIYACSSAHTGPSQDGHEGANIGKHITTSNTLLKLEAMYKGVQDIKDMQQQYRQARLTLSMQAAWMATLALSCHMSYVEIQPVRGCTCPARKSSLAHCAQTYGKRPILPVLSAVTFCM